MKILPQFFAVAISCLAVGAGYFFYTGRDLDRKIEKQSEIVAENKLTLTQHDTAIVATREDVDTNEGRIEVLEKELKLVESQLKATNEELQQQQAELDRLAETDEKRDTEIAKLRQDVSALRELQVKQQTEQSRLVRRLAERLRDIEEKIDLQPKAEVP